MDSLHEPLWLSKSLWLMHRSCCEENHHIYRFPVPNLALWYTRCPDSIHTSVPQLLSYCACGSHLHPALGNFPWLRGDVSHRCLEGCRVLPNQPQVSSSLGGQLYNAIHLPELPTPYGIGVSLDFSWNHISVQLFPLAFLSPSLT